MYTQKFLSALEEPSFLFAFFVKILQLVVGILAIGACAILGLGDENMIKSTITLVLAVAYVILGIAGIVDYKFNK